MFSGGTPTRTPRRVSSRRASAAPSAAAESVASTSGSPPPARLPTRTLGSGLRSNRAVSASPAPSRSRRAQSTAAISEDENEVALSRPIDSFERILVRDDTYIVSERKGLPTEVEQIVASADPYTDPFRAHLDTTTGFALLISRDFCFVWNWSKRSAACTTYVFPLAVPTVISAFSPLSFASFVPASSQPSLREPGLIVVSIAGHVRYWENVSMALSGVNRWKSVDATLLEGELIRGITLHSSSSYLLATSLSRILLVTLSSIGGKTELGVRAFDRAVGWAGSVWNFFGGKGAADPRAGILALAISSPTSHDGERIAYAISDRNAQVWRLPGRDDAGGERLFIEQDIFAAILEAIHGEKLGNEAWAINEGKVEILDAQVAKDGNVAILISHVTPETAVNALSYAVVMLVIGTTQGSVSVLGIRTLAYQALPDPRPFSTPTLSLSSDAAAFVIFVDTVIMVSLDLRVTLEETFPLRSSTNRFLGVSSSTAHTLSLLTSTASILSVEITAPQGVDPIEASSEKAKTRRLKSKIEQAIFFGVGTDNPLGFDLLPGFEGDLITAAEAVSAEILTSSSTNLPVIIDLRAQLADRVMRARALIDYINSNGLLGKLSQSSRRQLSADAERMSAAVALWHHQNARLADGDDGQTLLADAIASLVRDSERSDDTVRQFFRTKVSKVGSLVEATTKLSRDALATVTDGSDRSTILYEANTILLLVFKAVQHHRYTSSTLYGLDGHVLPTEPWSARTSILEGLHWHFEASDAILRERSRDFGTALDEDQASYGSRVRSSGNDIANQQALQADFKRQMAELSDFIFGTFVERILYLQTLQGDGPTTPELKSVKEKYLVARPQIIHILVKLDKVNHAYDLAERFEDFRSLVELCNDSKHGSEAHTRKFMQKYSENFAFALYNFLLEKGAYRELLEQDELYRPLLTKFLDTAALARLDWINDLAIGRYAHAMESLVGEASTEQNLKQKKLMLSIGKLSLVAQATKATISSAAVQRPIEAVDDVLDLVGQQESLSVLFRTVLSASDMRRPIQDQAELITTRLASGVAELPSLTELFALLSSRLLEGITLSAEDLIDLQTLKTNDDTQVSSYGTAVEILVRAKDIPEARHAITLQTIWRRVYLRDDWSMLHSAVAATDEQVSQTLRETALFATLSAAQDEVPREMFLSPNESLFTGSLEELAARFPEAEPESIQGLWSDLEAENERIREHLSRNNLEMYCREIGRVFAGSNTMRE